MTLADYTPPSATVPIGNNASLILRGLSLSDAAVLIREHFPDLDALWDLIAASTGGNLTPEAFGLLAQALVSNAPGFAANVIALAAGEEEHAEKAQMLPAGAQISALLKISELTFADYGGPGKGMGAIAALLKMKMPTIKTHAARATRKSNR